MGFSLESIAMVRPYYLLNTESGVTLIVTIVQIIIVFFIVICHLF